MRGAISRRRLSALFSAALLAGCASLPQPVVEDIHPQRLARRADVVHEFDARRDEADYAAARDAWRRGDLAECRTRLDRLLSRDAGHRQAALLRAEVALAEGAPQSALPLLEQLAASRPDDANLQHALARLREAAQRSEVSLADFEQPADSCVGEAEIVAAAGEHLCRGEAGAAARVAEQGLRRHARSAPLYRLLGLARYREGNYAAAEAALRQALSLDNSSGLAYFLLGSALHRLGQTEAAEEHFRRARSLDPRF